VNSYLVVTITCPDRPGIVELVTGVIRGFSANWEESRMARLGGDFAGIVKISVAEEKAEALAEAIRALADDQMAVTVRVSHPAPLDTQDGHTLFELRLAGADHDGIVHTVAGYLAGLGINVEAMETEVVAAPISGSPLFQMDALIKVPPQQSPADLSTNLRRIGEELGVDIEICPCQATL
jgi:glycine cleavage system regulatory protein